jgi:lysozyme
MTVKGLLWRVMLGIGLVGALALAAWAYARGWTPSRSDFPVQGVSVDATTGAPEWGTIAANGADFAYVRAVQGDRPDPSFAKNWAGARKAGLRYGAALDMDLCRLAADQATRFIATVPRDNAALPPVVRLAFGEGCKARPGRATVLAEVQTLIEMIEAHTGKPALLNISADFEEAYQLSAGINRTLWLDGDYFPPDYASRPWVMWTANAERHIDGADQPVRWDVVAP